MNNHQLRLIEFYQNVKSFLSMLFSAYEIDDHYVIRIFGIKFCKKFSPEIKFTEVTEKGITTDKRNPKILISLTTFPPRINSVYKTISTLLEQTVKPDEVVLWLATEDFPDKKLPENLTNLQTFGLTIKWCDNIKSYKKLIPALAEYPDDIIITVDDDYYYDKDLVKNLLEEHKKYPDCIIGARANRLVPQKDKSFKLKRRSYIYDSSYRPSYLNPFIGFGGVLYPPHALHKDVMNKEKFMTIIPTNDDAWFWINAVRNKTRFVPCRNGYKLKFYLIENSQQVGLYQVNGPNSAQGVSGEDAANMFMKMYPDAKEIIDGELHNA